MTISKLCEFIKFNPTEHLTKGLRAIKINMDDIDPFSKYIDRSCKAIYTGSGSKFKNKDTLMARITPCLENGKTAFVDCLPSDDEVGFGSSEFIVMRAIEGKSDPDFIYYLTISDFIRKKAIKSMIGTSGRQRVQLEYLKNIEVELPDLAKQIDIGKKLSLIDSKIKTNNRIIYIINSILDVSYKLHFNSQEQNNDICLLEDFCNIFTGKRNANEEDHNGKYLFFTCGKEIKRINSFLYDGPAVIISGNGSYTGRTLFYNGKFDLYQRTYCCTLKANIPICYIYGLFIIIKNSLHKKISGGTRGSSIPYIVYNDLAKFQFSINKVNFLRFSKKVQIYLTYIQNLKEENEKLVSLKNIIISKIFR